MAEAPKRSSATMWIVGCSVTIILGIFGVGILAAIAIPAFVNYARRAKTAEATATLHQLSSSTELFCQDHASLPRAAAPTLAHPSSTREMASSIDPAWSDVSYAPYAPQYYAYTIERPNETTAVIAAIGDLDDDGVQSRFEVTCTLEVSTSSCMCSPIAITNELE